MSRVMMPVKYNNQINTLMTKLWWAETVDTRKVHFTDCKNLCRSIWEGGLGFPQMPVVNQALVSKQMWRVINNPSSPLSDCIIQKYSQVNLENLFNTPTGASWRRQSICKAATFIKSKLQWHIADSHSPLWWTSYCPFRRGLHTVWDLINHQSNNWNASVLNNLYSPEAVRHIIWTPLSIFGALDKRIWIDHTSVSYSVRLGYKALMEQDT